MAIELDISPLEKAIASLEDALNRQRTVPADDLVRDGCIQRFEYTYELSHKMLKRYLELSSPNPREYDGIEFQNLIRTGNERGLLKSDWRTWKNYREKRGTTSHTYDGAKAAEVFEIIPAFLLEARFLSERLKKALE